MFDRLQSQKGLTDQYGEKVKKKNVETQDTPKGRSVMEYHVLRGRHRLADLHHNALYRPVGGPGTLRVTRYKNGVSWDIVNTSILYYRG